jgi:mono/diheme cytochrome c family protein
MNSLFEILLKKPLSDVLLQGLLFITFTLHMLFVLLTIGTAVLALYYFIHSLCGKRLQELRWDKEILRTFLAHKSLAVVLGVAPLLLIQVRFTVPFFTALNLVAPFWMLIIPFLIVAFLSFDALGHKMDVHPYLHLAIGIIALIFLFVVPGIFVASLVITENPEAWLQIVKMDYQLSNSLAIHWLLRYLHGLRAAILFGAAFHYFFSTKGDREKKSTLLKWIVAGILLQFVLGIMLYSSLPEKPDNITIVSLMAGVIAAGLLLWVIFLNLDENVNLSLKTAVPLLLLVLIPMLLARQSIQNRKLLPFAEKLQANALTYGKELEPYSHEALNQYKLDLKVVYDKGETIYSKSCAFCHGENAEGKGLEAKNLHISPEDISAIRTTRPYLHQILIKGVPGSAMPYFTFFDRYKLDGLIHYLDKKYHVLGLTEPIPVKVSEADVQEAQKIYAETCSLCHGMDGKGAKFSRGFRPQPPDFTILSLAPERAFKIVTDGYPGTAMPPFTNIKEDIRWGLVDAVNEKRMK